MRSPCIARARLRLMERPSPVPSCVEASLRSTCTNGSKIAPSFSWAMPIPLSVTVTRTASALLSQSISIVPPASDRMLHARARLPAGPDYALIHSRHGPQALVHELLDPLPLIRLRRIDVAPGIRGDAVHGEELAGLPAAVAEPRQDLERLPVHDVHALVPAVGEEDVLLLGIARERDVPHGAVATRARKDALLLHELAVLAKDLNPIVHAVADVHETIVRRLGAVHGIAELWRERRVGVVGAHVGVLRGLPIRAPEPLDRPGAHVGHRRALVAAAVRDVRLVRLRIEGDLGDAAEVVERVAVHRLPRRSDLHQELAVVGELENV